MKQHLEHLLQQALQELTAQPVSIHLERPRDPEHGDWSTAIAMVLAKSLQKPPRVIAEQLLALIPDDPDIETISLAGPGFINFKLNKEFLYKQLEVTWSSTTCGIQQNPQPSTVVIDYSSPNLAKEMHVGHLRSTIIGDSLARILTFLGEKVIRQNHIGDWGTQFGMLLAHMDELQQHAQTPFKLTDLESFYLAAKQRFDHDAAFAENARGWVVKLQTHDPVAQSLWQRFIDLSLAHCQDLYTVLAVQLEPADVRAESAYNPELPKIIHRLQEQNLIREEDGTKCVYLEQFSGKDQQPLPIIVQKKDGGFLYASTDLAAIDYRCHILHADRILYVVDARQSLHFQQIFALAKLAGFATPNTQLEHIDFGMILNKAGKPFKSRDGGVTKLIDLLDEAQHRANTLIAEKNPHLSAEECQMMAKTIGIAAVKYADLSKNRISDYIFDWDTMLSFEGNTAPYLLYANTRIHSLLRKAELAHTELNQASFTLVEPQELTLAKHILLFSDTVVSSAQKATPHLLCTYLYELAGLFSSFYEACPILSSDIDRLKHSRLKLAALTSKVLEQGLALLGIPNLTRMWSLMPELPEVETTLLGLKPHILQQTVLAVTIRQYQLRWPIHPNLSSELIGQTVLNLTRRGKYIIVALNRGSLLIHLGMSGRCAVLPVTTPAKKHDHVDIQITAQMLLRYTDPRRFGAIVWIPDTNPLEHPLLAKLGLEPFDPKFDGDYLWERAQNKKMLLKAFIMDQRIVVGVGNIYATEALFKTGLHPALPCKLVNKQQMHQLAQTIQSLLKYAIQAGGTSLKDFLQADGKPGYFKLQLQIYDKATQPCPICKNPLEKMQIGQRSSVFCAICQPKPTRHPENGIPVWRIS